MYVTRKQLDELWSLHEEWARLVDFDTAPPLATFLMLAAREYLKNRR